MSSPQLDTRGVAQPLEEGLYDRAESATLDLTQLRAKTERWVEDHWDPEQSAASWWRNLAAAGYTAPTLPIGLGGQGLTPDADDVVRAVLTEYDVLGPPSGVGLKLVAPTLVRFGSPSQIARFLPGIVDGSEAWCQLFSEPEAGSDLASLSTTATLRQDTWVLHGEKIWSSNAMDADWGLLLARTGSAPRHRGITAFAVHMRQPGVRVTPLRDSTGGTEFAHVTLDDACVEAGDMIGPLHSGWTVTMGALAIERNGYRAGSDRLRQVSPGVGGGHLERPAGTAQERTTNVLVISHTEVSRLAELARRVGRGDDSTVRQGLARLHTLVRLAAWNSQRQCTRGAANIGKLLYSESFREARSLSGDILGPDATLVGDGSVTGGWAQRLIVFSTAPAIYGGTNEIQRNVLAERELGLPRNPNT